MTEAELLQLVTEWDSFPDTVDSTAGRYNAFLDRLEWFGRGEWANYLPAEHTTSSSSYMRRLAKWIANTDDESQRKLLLEYALQINFFSERDFAALYQSALVGPITRWIVDDTAITLEDDDFDNRVEQELNSHTWYCPVTDSLRINDFYHINRITGIDRRPAFREYWALSRLSSTGANENVAQIGAYMRGRKLKRLVLLEDFVGSGDQVRAPLEWTLQNLKCPVLFVPLIICPPGIEMTEDLEARYLHFHSRPIIRLKPDDLLGPRRKGQPFAGKHDFGEELERLASETYPRVAGSAAADPSKEPYSPMGYEEIGCSVVTFTNTPNNTLPLVHHQPTEGTWIPLFPRSTRVA